MFGNPGERHTIEVDLDKSAPVIRGLPERCTLRPPDGRLVRVADVSASDALSGLGNLSVRREQRAERRGRRRDRGRGGVPAGGEAPSRSRPGVRTARTRPTSPATSRRRRPPASCRSRAAGTMGDVTRAKRLRIDVRAYSRGGQRALAARQGLGGGSADGMLERVSTQQLLMRRLPAATAIGADVGGRRGRRREPPRRRRLRRAPARPRGVAVASGGGRGGSTRPARVGRGGGEGGGVADASALGMAAASVDVRCCSIRCTTCGREGGG